MRVLLCVHSTASPSLEVSIRITLTRSRFVHLLTDINIATVAKSEMLLGVYPRVLVHLLIHSMVR
jgi:c-di-GMP-related signal transduction protein